MKRRAALYLRHAGALPLAFGDPEQAIDDLRASLAVPCVQHPAINPVLSQHEVPGGFRSSLAGRVCAVVRGRLCPFPRVPLVQRLAWYDTLVDALAACEQQGIIPLGLSDTHLIIHDQNRHIALTTIHRFRQLPTTSAPARTPGMPWYRAPECQQEVALDETTAVFDRRPWPIPFRRPGTPARSRGRDLRRCSRWPAWPHIRCASSASKAWPLSSKPGARLCAPLTCPIRLQGADFARCYPQHAGRIDIAQVI